MGKIGLRFAHFGLFLVGNLAGSPGVDKYLFTRRIFRARNFTCAPDRARTKMGAQNQIMHPIETQLEIIIIFLFNFDVKNKVKNYN